MLFYSHGNPDYAKFVVVPINNLRADDQGTQHVRITVKADGKMAHANDQGVSRKDWPAFIVSTLSQRDDDYNHFVLKKQKSPGRKRYQPTGLASLLTG